MPETLTDKELLEITKKLLETYESELERESVERDKQSVVDSKQAEILAKEKVAQEEKETLLNETSELEKQELVEFRANLMKSINKLEPINYTDQFVMLDSRLQTIETNTNVSESIENSSFYADISIMFFLWFIFPAIFMYKALDWFFHWM